MRTESIFLAQTGDFPEFPRHPAKMHPYLARTLVRDYSEPGDRVLDPFVGAGTTMWAAEEELRWGYGIDIEECYTEGASQWGEEVSKGDARDLPWQDEAFELVVTSPPYGEAIGRAGDRNPDKTKAAKARYETRRFGRRISGHAIYGNSSPGNLGCMPLERKSPNIPTFKTEMPKAMGEIARILVPGGIAAVVVKDQRLGRRALGAFNLPGAVVSWGQDHGLIYIGRRFAIIPQAVWTLWQRVNEKRWGHPVPDVEQVIVLQKPTG